MNLTIANISSIDDATFAAVVSAISQQVSQHFQPEWGIGATLTPTRLALGGAQVNVAAPSDAIVYVGDSSSDSNTGVGGVAGYHDTNHAHIPYAFVYLNVCQQYNEEWSCTLSHEVLELLADPTAVQMVIGPSPKQDGTNVYYSLEVCDPTQGDSYPIDNVTVSNFVTKAYFRIPGGSAYTNYLNLALDPFGARPHGYFQYEDGGATQQIDGMRVDAGRLAARKMLGEYRRNARRSAKLNPPPIRSKKTK